MGRQRRLHQRLNERILSPVEDRTQQIQGPLPSHAQDEGTAAQSHRLGRLYPDG